MSGFEKDKIYNAFRRLNACPGNIVTITIPNDLSLEQIKEVSNHTKALGIEHQVTIIYLSQGFTVGELTETQMKAFGWIRDPNWKISKSETLN